DEWAEKLQREHDNLRAALRWSEKEREAATLLEFTSSLFFFWLIRGHAREGRRWLDAALKVGEEAEPHMRAKTLWALGNMLLGVFDIPGAYQKSQQSLSIARELGDKQSIARALDLQAWIATFFGGLPMAKPLFEESIELAREVDDQWTLAHALQGAGNMFMWSGDPASARTHLESSVEVATNNGDRSSLRGASVWLGGAAMWQGEFNKGRALLEQAVADARQAKDRNYLSTGLYFLGPTLVMSGDYEAAQEAANELLKYARDGGNPILESGALFT
ncbi:MAG: tetratricopeptide repeat protein, partial [Acidimicrobiia bacterium]